LPLQQIVCLQHPAKRNGMRRNAFDEMTEPDERQCLRSHATYRDADLRMAAASDRRPLTPLPRADRPGSLLPGHLCSARACRSSLSSHRNARAVPESFEYPSRSPAGAWQMSVAVSARTLGNTARSYSARKLPLKHTLMQVMPPARASFPVDIRPCRWKCILPPPIPLDRRDFSGKRNGQYPPRHRQGISPPSELGM
jgi:hypothetical protein